MDNVIELYPSDDRRTNHAVDQQRSAPICGQVDTYTVNEVAAVLKIGRNLAYELIRGGTIPAKRCGRRWVVSRRRLHMWLDGLEETG